MATIPITSPTANVNDQLSDEQLTEAIVACYPFTYLKDLTRRVAVHLGCEDLASDDKFSYRVYLRNREVAEIQEAKRISDMGFVYASDALLSEWNGRKVDMLSNGVFGESIQTGVIRPNGRGGYLFLPKGRRKNGYVPTLLREARGASDCPLLTMINVNPADGIPT